MPRECNDYDLTGVDQHHIGRGGPVNVHDLGREEQLRDEVRVLVVEHTHSVATPSYRQEVMVAGELHERERGEVGYLPQDLIGFGSLLDEYAVVLPIRQE